MGELTRTTRQGVQSVVVGLRLAQQLALARSAMTLKALAAAAGMPAAKAHRYLVSLIRVGLVEQQPVTGRYDLGWLAIELGLSALGRLDLVELATRALLELREAVGETVLLGVWGNRGPTVIRWLEGPRPVTVNVQVGSVMPLLTSATGRAFLAWLPTTRTHKMVERELADPGCPLKGLAPVEALVSEILARGLSRVQGEMLSGVAAFGAPVFDHRGEMVAALTALGADTSFDANWDGAVAVPLREAAARLSRRLGYRGNAANADHDSAD
ncbi:MAG: IclR family transcriptional regulator [Rhodanobacteraceae bacterium]